ncbi:tetratricopeptide repeat protein [Streptomyces sp. 4N509B]|uniref:tetratricopeptide repeat protein n=1 Tax=Streptomyces sp. 4N509B TaxID=3457413 RepID=UPI003FD628D8
MELFGAALVGTLAHAMVTGAGEEAGRRGLGPVAALLGRLRLRRGAGQDPVTPRGTDEDGAAGGTGDGDRDEDEAVASGRRAGDQGAPDRMRELAEEIVRAAREDRATSHLVTEVLLRYGELPPARVPAPHRRLVDRREQLATARRLVAAAARERPVRLLLLGQRPGAGTSELARHLPAELGDLLPDDHLRVDLAGGVPGREKTPEEAATELLHDLSVPLERIPAQLPGKLRELRRRLDRRQTLLILDNARSAEQVAPLLVGGAGSLTVITASHRMPALVHDHGARVVHVGPLMPPDDEALLAEVAGRERVRSGGAAAREALRLCHGHARTICEVAAQAQFDVEPDWRAIARELRGDGGPRPDADPTAATVARGYAGLTAEAARLHRLLGRLPALWLADPSVAALAGRDPARTRSLLDELSRRHLLVREADRYRLTAPAHRHAATQPEPAADVARAVGDWAAWCLTTAATAQTTVMPGRWYLGELAARLAAERATRPPTSDEAAAALRVLRRERAVLVAAVGVAASHGLPETAWQLCESMWALHLRLGYHEDCLTTHALGVEAARALGDRRAEARMLVQRGFSQRARGQDEAADAAFGRAFAAEPEDHPRGRATALESRGLLRLERGDAEAAEGYLRAALPFAEQAGDPRALALLALHVGRALTGRRRFPDALDQLDAALRAMRALPVPDLYNVGRVLTCLGEARLAAGDAAGAAGPLDEALEIMTAEGAVLQEAHVAELRARCEPEPARRRALVERAWQLRVALGEARTPEDLAADLAGDPTVDPPDPDPDADPDADPAPGPASGVTGEEPGGPAGEPG